MKRWQKWFLGLISLILILVYSGQLYFNNGGTSPDNSVWQAYIGRDTTVGILPDEYANYFTYTLVRTNKNIGFKIQGDFPDTRYMSFNVYSLQDYTTQGSLIDYQIETDSGKPNPFLANKDSVAVGKSFTTYVVPERYEESELPNKLVFRDDERFLLMVIRLYDFNKDDFGGVEYPTVQAFTLDDDSESNEENITASITPVNLPRNLDLRYIVRKTRLPKMVERLNRLFKTEQQIQFDGSPEASKTAPVPFHGLNTNGYIENNDNRYLMAAITKQEDEVYYFRFKAPTYTTGSENINKTDVRYWSFNLGNHETYNFEAIKDEDALVDDNGYVHIVLGDEDKAIQAKAKTLGYNFMKWNMPWKKGFILFRHMLANPDFEAQIINVPPFDDHEGSYEPIEAHHFMGDYAPQGVRMTKADFLNQTGF